MTRVSWEPQSPDNYSAVSHPLSSLEGVRYSTGAPKFLSQEASKQTDTPTYQSSLRQNKRPWKILSTDSCSAQLGLWLLCRKILVTGTH